MGDLHPPALPGRHDLSGNTSHPLLQVEPCLVFALMNALYVLYIYIYNVLLIYLRLHVPSLPGQTFLSQSPRAECPVGFG